MNIRKEGLTWIIKSIWNLGEKVLASYLPSFLDETSISYLFDYAGREVEMNKIKKKLDDVRLFMKIKRERIKLNEKNLKNYKRENSLGATHYTFKTGLDSNDGGLLDDRSELGDFEITSDMIIDLFLYVFDRLCFVDLCLRVLYIITCLFYINFIILY